MKTPVIVLLFSLLSCCGNLFAAPPAGKEMCIVVLGDSLTAGYGLAMPTAFPARLQAALQRRGQQLRVVNAGISGDTSMGGLARLDWALADRPDLMIVALGANDALRGLDPAQTRQNINSILSRLQKNGVKALLAGMKAPRNLGEDYYTRFDRIYPQLARQHNVPFYPFFLDGVAGNPGLNQTDGIHPTAAGVEIMVQGILPLVEETLARIVETAGECAD
ncbi:MAG: arylesterase [Desulfuromonadales bacterium C00003093]|nr:MAG: arylesterase [Desulfuromonadales bacterium C00003093]